jgi:hypothetical protein
MVIARSALKIKESWLLYAAFFSLGMNLAVFYVPVFGLYLLVAAPKITARAVSRNYLVLSALLLAATVPVYILGYDNIALISPFRSMVIFVLSTVAVGCLFQFRTAQEQRHLTVCYVFGLASIAIYISITSIQTDATLYGYGRLHNPFTGEDINSPGVSNSLAMFSALIVYILFTDIGKTYRVVLSVLLLTTIVVAISLGGRAYFVILCLAFFLKAVPMIFKSKLIPATGFVALVALMVAAVSASLERMEDFDRYYQILSYRFESGLESSRFEHYADGLGKLFLHPFGGFETDPAIEVTPYFHNVFLDNARLGGWIPLAALLLMVALAGRALPRRKNPDVRFGLYVFFISLLIMQQDVVIEGNSQLLVIAFYAAVLVSRRKSGLGAGKPVFEAADVSLNHGLIRS